MSFFDFFDLPPSHRSNYYHYPSQQDHSGYHHHPSRHSRPHRSHYPHPHYDIEPSPPAELHPLHRHRRRQLERDALRQPPSRRTSSIIPTDYEDSLRAERARRLAEAKLAQQSRSDDQTPVELTLPDGRQCVVPLSWARKIQSKYPSILTNSMIKPHDRIRPASPIQLEPVPASESDHDSDFFVLDPTQDPSVPVLNYSSPSPAQARPKSPVPQAPQHSPEELDAAARLIQQQFRTYRSLKYLDELESKFQDLKAGFTFPSPLDLTFLNPPNQESIDSAGPTSTKLAFNNPVNRPVQAFEENLTLLQIKADAVVSRGNSKIKNWRKRLIKDIESQLDQLDRFKTEAWNSQKYAILSKSGSIDSPGSRPQSMMAVDKPQSCDAIEKLPADQEMNDEIMNTDAESVSSDHLSTDSTASASPLKTSELAQRLAHQGDDLIIPVVHPDRPSPEDLVIPTSTCSGSSPRSDSIVKSHLASQGTHRSSVSSCRVIAPLVTQEGDLVCPAPPAQTCDDNILVSPV